MITNEEIQSMSRDPKGELGHDYIKIAKLNKIVDTLKLGCNAQNKLHQSKHDYYAQGVCTGVEIALLIMQECEPIKGEIKGPAYAQPYEKETNISLDGKEIAKNIRKHAYTGL